MHEEEIILQISPEDKASFTRLDHFLNAKLTKMSRSFIKNLFIKDHISAILADSCIKLELNKMPPIDAWIKILVPPPQPSTAIAENLPLEILFEDEYLIIVNKAAGMVTHPAPGNYTGTLVNAILFHCQDLKGVGDEKRPGIVHRLDKGTSGVMVVAKTHQCHEKLVQLFASHDIERYYQAICIGNKIPQAGTLTSTLGRHPQNRLKMAVNVRNGKQAITHYKVQTTFKLLTHIECKLETGRTHQIRVHMASLLNAPILYDPLYGKPTEHKKRVSKKIAQTLNDYPYPFLHAKILGFIHPITKKQLHFQTPPPAIFDDVLKLAASEL